jgi:hypothetical protein
MNLQIEEQTFFVEGGCKFTEYLLKKVIQRIIILVHINKIIVRADGEFSARWTKFCIGNVFLAIFPGSQRLGKRVRSEKRGIMTSVITLVS